MSERLSNFVQAGDVEVFDFPWCRCHWLCRPGLVEAERLLLVKAFMPAGEAHQFHYHPFLEELIYVVRGQAEQWVGRESRLLGPGEMAHIPTGTVHATYNSSPEPLEFLAILAPAAAGGPAVIDVFREQPWRELKPPRDYPAPYQRWPEPAARPDWDERYRSGDLPWDSGLPSRELARVLDERAVAPCRAIELGCGTGTNSVLLAKRSFTVTGIDLSPTAVRSAAEKAHAAGVAVEFRAADVATLDPPAEPFEFLFDRGCYHCVRKDNLEGYLAAVARLTRPGARCLILAGNADEPAGACGMPRVSAGELCSELGRLGTIEGVRPFHFEDVGGAQGPLAWSCLVRRR